MAFWSLVVQLLLRGRKPPHWKCNVITMNPGTSKIYTKTLSLPFKARLSKCNSLILPCKQMLKIQHKICGAGEGETVPFIAALLHLVSLDSSLESWHLPKSESNTLQTIHNQQQEKATQKSWRVFCSLGVNKNQNRGVESQLLRPSIHFLPNYTIRDHDLVYSDHDIWNIPQWTRPCTWYILLPISEVSQLVLDFLYTFRQLWISDIRLVVSDSDSVSGKPCPVLSLGWVESGKIHKWGGNVARHFVGIRGVGQSSCIVNLSKT